MLLMIDMDEIVQRYKTLSMWIRVLCTILPAVVLAAYLYFDSGEQLSLTLESAAMERDSERVKFEQARSKKANLPQLEERLAFTEEQIQKAKEHLPETYGMDDVLHKTATIAKEIGVELETFDPATEVAAGDAFKYAEKPIDLVVVGKFNQVAAFFDRLIHLEKMVHLRGITVKKESGKGDTESKNAGAIKGGDAPKVLTLEEEEEGRTKIKVSGRAKMIVFRSLREGEVLTPGSGDMPGVDGKIPQDQAPAAAPPAQQPTGEDGQPAQPTPG